MCSTIFLGSFIEQVYHFSPLSGRVLLGKYTHHSPKEFYRKSTHFPPLFQRASPGKYKVTFLATLLKSFIEQVHNATPYHSLIMFHQASTPLKLLHRVPSPLVEISHLHIHITYMNITFIIKLVLFHIIKQPRNLHPYHCIMLYKHHIISFNIF